MTEALLTIQREAVQAGVRDLSADSAPEGTEPLSPPVDGEEEGIATVFAELSMSFAMRMNPAWIRATNSFVI
jgi:hypothetical protein